MQKFEDREQDKGDQMAFALAGLSNVATSALHENLMPGPRGWVDQYPSKLVEDLERWVSKIKDLEKPSGVKITFGNIESSANSQTQEAIRAIKAFFEIYDATEVLPLECPAFDEPIDQMRAVMKDIE